MGSLANAWYTNASLAVVTAVIVGLNVFLLYRTIV